MNVERFDFGRFSVFVNIFTANAGGEYAHHHDDLLSYSVFYEGREVLVDLGRTDYRGRSAMMEGEFHNGLNSKAFILRPCARGYLPRRWYKDAITLASTRRNNFLEYSASNKFTGCTKNLSISRDKRNNLLFREKIAFPGNAQNIDFSHFYACQSEASFHPKETSIVFNDLRIEYHNSLRLDKVQRSQEYGKQIDAYRVNIGMGIATSIECRWDISELENE